MFLSQLKRGGAAFFERPVVLFRACLLVLVVGAYPGWALAADIWKFVDSNGVVHIGNAAPATLQGFIGLNSAASETAGRGRTRATSALRSPGFDAAKPHLEAAALAQSLEPALVFAVAAAESAFNVEAVSRKGALGLMQVMPATAERYGVAANASPGGRHAVMEPVVNAQVGSRYLADLLRLFDGDKELALAAYNAGEGTVIKYGRRIPPYPETQLYVEKVMRLYRSLTQ